MTPDIEKLTAKAGSGRGSPPPFIGRETMSDTDLVKADVADLIGRLKARAKYLRGSVCAEPMLDEAADAIEALTAERDGLREALKPFAQYAPMFIESMLPDAADAMSSSVEWIRPVKVGDFRRARSLSSSTEGA